MRSPAIAEDGWYNDCMLTTTTTTRNQEKAKKFTRSLEQIRISSSVDITTLGSGLWLGSLNTHPIKYTRSQSKQVNISSNLQLLRAIIIIHLPCRLESPFCVL